MNSRPLAAALLAAAGLVSVLLPARPAGAVDTPQEPPVGTVIPANDLDRKSILDAYTAAAAAGATGADALVKALTDMQSRRSDDFVPAIKANVENADPKVQAAAIGAAAAHELKDLEKTVRKVLHAKPKKSGADVPGFVWAACVDYLDRVGIAGEEQFTIDELLKPLLADEKKMRSDWAKTLEGSVLHYLGRQKWKPCVPWIIEEMLPQPVPANPTDPRCPPASYWEARQTLWHDHEGWARWVLKEITGKEYRSVGEWKAWLKQQDKKAFK